MMWAREMSNEWSRTTRYLTLIAILSVLAIVIFLARELIGPIVIACLFAYILKPGVSFMEKHMKVSTRRAVLVVYLLFLVSILAMIISFVPLVTKQARNLSQELLIILPRLEEAITHPVRILGYDLSVEPLFNQLRESASQFIKPDRIFRVIQSATQNLIWVLVILVTTYYLLRDWEQLREWFIHLAPEPYQPDIRRLHVEIKTLWRSYLRGQLLLMIIIGFLTGLASAVVGLSNALLLGLLAGALDIIPSIGPIVAMAVAAMIAWFHGSILLSIPNAWFTVLVLAIFGFIQLIENVWIQPQIYGHHLRLHRGLVYIAIIGAFTLGSALLALIIIPLIGSALVIGGYLRRRILNLDPWPTVPSQQDPLTSSRPIPSMAEQQKQKLRGAPGDG
jgi:predicted PurR-regulated permease PerM